MSAENKIIGEYNHAATYDSIEMSAGREEEDHYERYSAHSS